MCCQKHHKCKENCDCLYCNNVDHCQDCTCGCPECRDEPITKDIDIEHTFIALEVCKTIPQKKAVLRLLQDKAYRQGRKDQEDLTHLMTGL